MNDIIEIINDLKEVEQTLAQPNPILIQKIAKYERLVDEFENAHKDKIGDESPDLTWAGTSGYSV